MEKKIKYVVVTHQWEGKAIVEENGELKYKNLGVVGSEKRLTEVGAKKLFENSITDNTKTIEVNKLDDVKVTYEMSLNDFLKNAVVVDTEEEKSEEII